MLYYLMTCFEFDLRCDSFARAPICLGWGFCIFDISAPSSTLFSKLAVTCAIRCDDAHDPFSVMNPLIEAGRLAGFFFLFAEIID